MGAKFWGGVGKRVQATETEIINSQPTVAKITKFLYDGLNVIIERNVDPITGTETTIASYLRGLSLGGGIGGIISKTDATSQSYYYHYNGIGSVTVRIRDGRSRFI